LYARETSTQTNDPSESAHQCGAQRFNKHPIDQRAVREARKLSDEPKTNGRPHNRGDEKFKAMNTPRNSVIWERLRSLKDRNIPDRQRRTAGKWVDQPKTPVLNDATGMGEKSRTEDRKSAKPQRNTPNGECLHV